MLLLSSSSSFFSRLIRLASDDVDDGDDADPDVGPTLSSLLSLLLLLFLFSSTCILYINVFTNGIYDV